MGVAKFDYILGNFDNGNINDPFIRACLSFLGSSRLSVRSTKKLNPSMISNPQNDLRHIGHVGYDGAVFGDVSFIGDNYDKLPIKVGNTRELPSSILISALLM